MQSGARKNLRFTTKGTKDTKMFWGSRSAASSAFRRARERVAIERSEKEKILSFVLFVPFVVNNAGRMEPLTVELERALVRALKATWRDLNESLFKGRLQAPQILLSDALSRLGQWQRDSRSLEISRQMALAEPWGAVVEVLKHEMAHQFVSEVLGDPDGEAHGAAFREVCERLGIDGRAAGMPATSSDEPPRVLSRIAKLLALAGSANQHEAELAMAEAQRLMLAHNLETAASSAYHFRHLGRPTGRVSEAERVLANLLGEHFFVEVIWVPVWRAREGKRGSVLEVCGAPVNLEMASYVHEFLTRTAERLWDEYRRERKIESNRDRRTFVAGVMLGFKEKLDTQRARSREQGIVWVGDGDLKRYLKKRHPYIRWTHYSGSGPSDAHADGRAAGRGVVLHKPVGGGPSGSVKLLR